jgi:hypothetical protein
MERIEETGQLSFLCACGGKAVELKALGCCRSCYDRQYRSRRLFGGLRDRVLKRDGYRCRGCGAQSRLLVHHRDRRNEEELLLTLCIGCHMRVHHSYGFRHWLPAMLLRLWREWHEGEPVQLQLPLKNVTKRPLGGVDSIQNSCLLDKGKGDGSQRELGVLTMRDWRRGSTHVVRESKGNFG